MYLFFRLQCEISNVKPGRVASVQCKRKSSSRHLGLLSEKCDQQKFTRYFFLHLIYSLDLKLRSWVRFPFL